MKRISDVQAALSVQCDREAFGRLGWIPRAIASATHPYGDNPHENLFPLVLNAPAEARKGTLPNYDRQQGEGIVSDYLEQPHRHPIIDRNLAQMLIETEYYAYLSSQLAPNTFHRQPLKAVGPLATYFLNVIGSAVIVGLLIWGVSAIGGGWTVWVIGLLLAWLAFALIFQTVTLPSAWMKARKERAKIEGLASAMNDARLAIRTDGLVSVARVSDVVKRAADIGTIWPQSIFPLLEDVASRTSRF